MKKIFLALYNLILLTSISLALEITTVSAIVSDPQKFDCNEVCIEGLVSNLKSKTSKRGNPHTTFGLNDEKGYSITVCSFGTLTIKAEDKVKVTGIYEIEKRKAVNAPSTMKLVQVA